MLSRLIAIPFAIATIIFLILAIQNPDWGIYMAPPMVVLAIIYVLHPQIDWWWYQKHPPRMEAKGVHFLSQFSPYYQRLSEENKLKFRNRTMMIRLAKEFLSQADEKSVPEDARLIFAASQAQATFGLEDYLILDFEKVAVYPGPFPSPKYPELFHASETFEEETTNGYIFSLEHAMTGFMQSRQYYPVMLHEIFESLMQCNLDWNWPKIEGNNWSILEQISDFPTEALHQTINRPDFDPTATLLTYFLTFPEKFKAQQADLYAACADLLQQDPLSL